MQISTPPLKPMLVGVTPVDRGAGTPKAYSMGVQLFNENGKDITKDFARENKLAFSQTHNVVKLPPVESAKELATVLQGLHIQDTFSAKLAFAAPEKQVQKGPQR